MSDAVYLLYGNTGDYYHTEELLGVYSSEAAAEAAWEEYTKSGGRAWRTRADGSIYTFWDMGYHIVEWTLGAPATSLSDE